MTRRTTILPALLLIALAGCGGPSETKVGPAGAPPNERRNGAIAFERYSYPERDDYSAAIWVRTPDGKVRRLTPRDAASTAPAWSPDGTRIAFERTVGGSQSRLFTMRADGGDVQPLTSGCTAASRCESDVFPSWSPDGDRIAFERIYGPIEHRSDDESGFTFDVAARVDLMVVDALGGAPRTIARWGADPQPWDGAPSWSPDGNRLVLPLGTLRHPTKHTRLSTALVVMDARGRRQRRITPWTLGAASPDWSPDGSQIVFNSEGGHSRSIYVVRPDGGGLTLLLKGGSRQGLGGEGITPGWSPDGRQIVFASEPDACTSMHVGVCNERPFTFDLYVMNADGTGIRHVTSAPEFEGRPAWGAAR